MSVIVPVIAATIARVAELRQAVWSDGRADDAFAVTCTVSAVTRIEDRMCAYWITDGVNYGYVRTTNNVCPAAGERIVARGHVGADSFGWTDKYTLHPISSLYTGRILPCALPAVLTVIIAAVHFMSYEAMEQRRLKKAAAEAEKNAPAPSVTDDVP